MKKGSEDMRAIQVKVIRAIVGGKLIKGTEDGSIKQVIDYERHELRKKQTLVFIRKGQTIDWQALARYTPLVVISDKPEQELLQARPDITAIQVRSLQQAYWQFIEYYRSLFHIPVVAITGTCGKTTTKEMLKHMLSEQMTIQASISSKNEPRQSLPYLLGIDDQTEAAIFELGLGNTGNITHQCKIYQPTIGVLTNIGVHHLDGCQNLNGYIQAKAEIVKGVQPGGTLIINADDERIKKISLQAFQGKVVRFGIHKNADIYASTIRFAQRGMTCKLHVNHQTYNLYVPGFGEHQIYNALAAIAVVKEIDFPIPKALLRLRSYQPMERHLAFSTGVHGSTIIDDTWTNNPTSIEAAIKVVDAVRKDKKVIVVLGDIKRLGQFEKQYHQEVGRFLSHYPIDTLITIGKKARDIAKEAEQQGIKAEVQAFDEVAGVFEWMKPKLDAQTIVLIKGPMSSRSMIDFAAQLKQT